MGEWFYDEAVHAIGVEDKVGCSACNNPGHRVLKHPFEMKNLNFPFKLPGEERWMDIYFPQFNGIAKISLSKPFVLFSGPEF